MKELTLNKNQKYLLACSYGPDSMALFHLLYKNGYKFDVAIVNYNLRKESTKEVEDLREYCNEHSVRLYIKEVKEKIEKNIEAKCREIRYTFFKELVDQYHYDAVLVAHHQDDLLETYLLQKQRQNTPIYYGIKEKTIINGVEILRPLLGFNKEELHKICVDNNVPFAIDKTNLENTYLRNKIRHQVVETLDQNKRKELLQEIDTLNKCVGEIFSNTDFSKTNEINYIVNKTFEEQKYILNYLVKQINNELFLSKENVGHIIDVLKSKRVNIFTKIKNGIYLLKEYDNFYLLDNELNTIEYSYFLNKPGVLDTPYFYFDSLHDLKNRVSDYPIIIRNAEKGDKYKIKNYESEVSRLFIDWKVPLSKRRYWPVFESANGEIIYIPRFKKDFDISEDEFFYVKDIKI